MTEWNVFLIISNIIVFLFMVAKPLINLTQTLTKLNATVEMLKETLVEYRDNSVKEDKELWEHNKHQDKIIDNHEIRIEQLEGKQDK